MNLRQRLMERWVNFYPPMLGAGIRSRTIDERTIEVELNPIGIDPADFENIVDQSQQVRARRVNCLGKLHLLAGEISFGILRQHLGKNQ